MQFAKFGVFESDIVSESEREVGDYGFVEEKRRYREWDARKWLDNPVVREDIEKGKEKNPKFGEIVEQAFLASPSFLLRKLEGFRMMNCSPWEKHFGKTYSNAAGIYVRSQSARKRFEVGIILFAPNVYCRKAYKAPEGAERSKHLLLDSERGLKENIGHYTIFMDWFNRTFSSIFFHEQGHQLMYMAREQFSQKLAPIFVGSTSKGDGEWISAYGTTNIDEFFAEHYSLFMCERSLHAKLFPKMHEFIKGYLIGWSGVEER